MHTVALRAAPLFALALLMAMPAHAFRCGNHLIVAGDSRDKVIARCGEPSDVERTAVLRRPVIWYHGRPFHVGSDPIEVPVEVWTYNLGPNKLMRRVKFEGGLVTTIDTLGYGYWPTRVSEPSRPRSSD